MSTVDAPLREFRRRALGTVGLLLAYGVLCCIPLPGLNHPPNMPGSFSLAAIGAPAAASAFLTVEWAALIVPPWRRLRVSFSGRRKLDRAVWVVLLLLAASQAAGVVLAIEHVQDTMPQTKLITGIPSVIGLSLTLGAVATFYLARKITGLGLVNGLSLFMLAQAVTGFRSNLVDEGRAPTIDRLAAHPLGLLAAFLLTLAASLICLRRPRGADNERALELEIPTSSLQPVAILTGLLALPASFAAVAPEAKGALLAFTHSYGENPLLRFVCVMLIGSVLAWLLNRPRHLRALFERVLGEPAAGPSARQAFDRALPATLLFLAVITCCELTVVRLLGVYGLVPLLPAVVAVLLDLADSVRGQRATALSCAWRDPRPYVAAVARRALGEVGIDSHAFFSRQNTLFRIFGPYALTEIWVPTAELTRSRELLETTLGRDGSPLPNSSPGEPVLGNWNAKQRRLLGAIALLAVILVTVARP